MRRLICLICGAVLFCVITAACAAESSRSVVAFSEIQNDNTVLIEDIFEEDTTAAPTTVPVTTVPATTEPVTTAPATVAPEITAAEIETVADEKSAAPFEPESLGGGYYILNTNTKKFHLPNCSSVKKMNDKNKQEYSGDREEVIAMGYTPCKRCNP